MPLERTWVKVGLVETWMAAQHFPAVVTWMAAQHYPEDKCTAHKSTPKRGAGPGLALAFHS